MNSLKILMDIHVYPSDIHGYPWTSIDRVDSLKVFLEKLKGSTNPVRNKSGLEKVWAEDDQE